MEIFKLFGSIFINTDAAEKSMKSVGKTMEEIGGKVSKFGSRLTKTVTAGITGLGTAAIVSASGFEDAMAKVSTIADESEMSMSDMEKAILDLSNQTGISATAIAEDVYNAISAGQKTADAVDFVSSSTKLAKAGFAETGQSLDVLTTIMNAYGMEAEDVTRVSDVLIQTQNLGKTTVADLSSTMGKVIPTAKSYNVSLEQVASAYTITTAKGIATAESTTYINSMLNELGKSGTTVSNTLKEKTGKSFAGLMQEGYSLGDCLEIVDQAAKEQNLAFNDMWGSAEAAKAGVTLLGDSAEIFNSRLAEMNDVTGSTESAFEKLETSSYKLQKVINEAKNTLADLGSTILEMVVPYLEKGAEKVHEFAEWFKGLDDNTKETIVKIGLLVAAVGPLLNVFGKGISAVGQVITVGSKLSKGIGKLMEHGSSLSKGVTTVTGLFGKAASFIGTTLIPAITSIGAPVCVVILAITALVAIGVTLYKNWDEICGWASRAWGKIKDTVGSAVEKIKGFFTGFIESARELKEKVVSKFEELKEGAAEKFGHLKERAAEKVSEMKEKIVSRVEEMKENASQKISEMKEKITEGFQALKEKAAEKFSDLKEKWSEKFTDAKEKIVSTAEEIRAKVIDRVSDLKDKAVSGFEELKEKAAAVTGSLQDAVSERFQAMGSFISDKFEGIGGKISSLFSGVSDKVKGIVDKVKEFFKFDWKFPDIKLPHFKVEWDNTGTLGSLASKIGLPGIPKMDVEWYKKAMDTPMVMDEPTAFGISPSGKIRAGGEAGSEVVSGTETLMKMISAAVAENNIQLIEILWKIYDLLDKYLPDFTRMQIVLDTGTLAGELAVPMNEALGWLVHARGRRN